MTSDRIQSLPPEFSDLRGRRVQLGPTLDGILGRHAYPATVATLLGETLLLAVALASTLKYEGVFTLQIKGDGPVSLIVADVVATPPTGSDAAPDARTVRGTARFNPETLARMAADPFMPPLAPLGKGWLAFTVDQGPETERYQGIVALRGTTLAACVQHYFEQSEQVPTAIRLTLGQEYGAWKGTALLLQRLPPSSADDADGHDPANNRRLDAVDGAWLDRLLDHDGDGLLDIGAVYPGCRCSRERVAATLRALDRAEIASLQDDGVVTVTCEFCNTTYSFDDEQLAEVDNAA